MKVNFKECFKSMRAWCFYVGLSIGFLIGLTLLNLYGQYFNKPVLKMLEHFGLSYQYIILFIIIFIIVAASWYLYIYKHKHGHLKLFKFTN